MSRDSSGNYSLPLANVATGTTISSSWANTSFGDFATEFTNSLDRTGRGGMLAPLRCADGSAAAPSFSFTAETGSGFYRAGTNDVRIVMAASPLQKWTPTAVTIYPALTISGGVTGGLAVTGNLSATGNTTLGDAVGDTTTISGPTTVGGTLAVTGALSTNAGSETFQIKAGSADHTYLAFYARTASPSTRSGFIGYAAAASNDIAITNSLVGGLVALTPGSGGRVQVGGNIAFSGVSNPSSSTAFSNTITPANIPKVIAEITHDGAGNATVVGGFNITSAAIGVSVADGLSIIRVTFASAFASTTYFPQPTTSQPLPSQYRYQAGARTTTTMEVRMTNAAGSHANPSTTPGGFVLVVYGPQ